MIPSEAAHDTVAALGEIGLLQFKDLNTEKSAFQRTYANQVRCRARWGSPRSRCNMELRTAAEKSRHAVHLYAGEALR